MLANPWALLLLLLAAPIAWFYRRPSLAPLAPTATADLWRQALAEERARSWWLPRRRAASLAAQLLILAIVVLALAQARLAPPRTMVLVLDTSGSMNAADVAPSRFESARRHSLRLLESLPDGDRLAVVTGGAPVRVACPPSHDRRQLREALETIEVGTGTTLAADAVGLARQILKAEGHGRILVLSDACFPEATTLAAAGDVDLLTVGEPASNVGVRRVAARRDPLEPETARVLVDLATYPPVPTEDVSLRMQWDRMELTPPAEQAGQGGRSDRVVAVADAASGVFSVLLPSEDVLQADNRRDARIPPADLLYVASPGPMRGMLEAALRADRRVRFVESNAASAASGDGPVLIVQGDVPVELPPGPILVVAPTRGCDLFGLDGTIAHAVIARQDAASSIGAGLDLVGIALAEVGRLRLPANGPFALLPMATADGEPLLVTFERPEGRVAVLLGDTDSGELSHHAEFNRLLSQIVEWLVRGEERNQPHPDSREYDAFAASESDLLATAHVGAAADAWRLPDPRVPVWRLLGALAMLLLLVEWRLYHRRWIS